VLDVGCGNGAYLARLVGEHHAGRLVGVDSSAGMLAAARTSAGPGAFYAEADAGRLPFRAACCDVVLAAHMLYHVGDPRAVLREVRRVLRPGGRLVLVLNCPGHLRELMALVDGALSELGGVEPFPSISGLLLDDGVRLGREVFGDVTSTGVETELRVTDPEAVAGYVESLSVTEATGLPREAVVEHVRRAAARLIADEGRLLVHAASGCVVCR